MHMKSSEIPRRWRDVLDRVTRGETVTVMHYRRPVAVIHPYTEEEPAITKETTHEP